MFDGDFNSPKNLKPYFVSIVYARIWAEYRDIQFSKYPLQ